MLEDTAIEYSTRRPRVLWTEYCFRQYSTPARRRRRSSMATATTKHSRWLEARKCSTAVGGKELLEASGGEEDARSSRPPWARWCWRKWRAGEVVGGTAAGASSPLSPMCRHSSSIVGRERKTESKGGNERGERQERVWVYVSKDQIRME